jgi:predicted phosphodiesterase
MWSADWQSNGPSAVSPLGNRQSVRCKKPLRTAGEHAGCHRALRCENTGQESNSMNEFRMNATEPVVPPIAQLSRRAFLRGGCLFLGGLNLAALAAKAEANPIAPVAKGSVRIGLLSDVHYADKPVRGNRYYEESWQKMREIIRSFNSAEADLALQLGDFIDGGVPLEAEVANLRRIEGVYARFNGPRHYVLGNHCVGSLSKEQFMENCGARRPPYSFDQNGLHFVVLDACFRSDGVSYSRGNFDWRDSEIPPPQREWLRDDLRSTTLNSFVFVHQRLDAAPPYGVQSASEVRAILEESGSVLAVFQGHNHKNDYREINGIHYCTLQAVVEGAGPDNNAYSLMDVFPEGIRITGFRRHPDRDWDLAPFAENGAPEATLRIRRNTEGVKISWEDADYQLESARHVSGPWSPLQDQSSPIHGSSDFPRRFYRLRLRQP